MPDSKITALTALTAADPANDMFPIVDVSDTSMAASGTTKRISINNLLAAGGTATLASATITGDLTVDTSTLKVVAASDVVGISNASPLTGTDGGLTLGVIGSSKAMAISMFNCFARLRERDTVNNFAITTNIDTTNAVLDDNTRTSWKVRFGSGNDNFLIQRAAIGSTTFQDLYSISTTSAVWSDGAGGTRMTLNSTGLGIATAPASALSFPIGTTRAVGMTAATAHLAGNVSTLKFGINDGGGDFGGVHVFNINNGTYSSSEVGFFTGEGGVSVPTQRMRIDKSGNVIFSTPSTPPTLATNGQLTVNATSNTNLRFSYRGSDGTTRVANITLA